MRPIHNRIVWAEAAAAQRSIFSYSTGVPAASEALKDAWRLVNHFVQQVAAYV